MNIALYVDHPDFMELARKAVGCAKAHMECEVIHLNGGKESFDIGADKVIHVPIEGNFIYRRCQLHAMVPEALFIAADIQIQADVSKDFDGDLVVTTDMKPGHPSVKYNCDVTYCRKPEFWLKWGEAAKNETWPKGDWYEITRLFDEIAQEYNPKVLDGNLYNFVPRQQSDDLSDKKIVHFRGPRKAWMEGWHKPTYINTLNNSTEVILEQVKQNIQLDLPWFTGGETHKKALIVGGGPSLKGCLPLLRKESRNAHIFALNNTHDFLIDRGITPDYHVLLDSRRENIDFIQHPKKTVKYLISACCHPDIFKQLEGCDVTLWLTDMEGVEELVQGVNKPICLVGGGATVGMKTMCLTYLMGYRKLHFFGFDSSYDQDDNHAYPQPLNDSETRQKVLAAGKEFICAPWMMRQAEEFQFWARKLSNLGCTLTIHGYGLIPHIAQHMGAA